MKTTLSALLGSLLAVCMFELLPAEDWPQWRGPHRDQVSREKGLLPAWPEGGPPLLWTFKDSGIGFSSPAVVGDRIYIMGSRNGVEQLLSLDARNGKELWALEVGDEFQNSRGNGPRGTPSIVDGRVFALGAYGDLVAADADSGALLWKVSMRDLGGSPPNWGYSESVLVDQGRVVCTPGGPRGTLAALDANNGKLLWQSSQFTSPAHYSSPIVIEWAGVRQYVQLTVDALVGIRATDGGLLWRSDWPGRTAVVPTPVYQEGRVFITSGYGVGSKLVRLDASNNVSDVYFNKVMKNHHGGVVLLDGHLYGYSDGRGWMCMDFAGGEEVWSEKEALGKGAIAYADGRFYLLGEQDGTVVLIDASPEGWKERGRFQLTPDSELRQARWLFWTHPVISDGRLYLRNQELLFAYDIGE